MPLVNGVTSSVGSSRRTSRTHLAPVNDTGVLRSPVSRTSDGSISRLSDTKKWRIVIVLVGMMSITATIVYSSSFTTNGLLRTLLYKRSSKFPMHVMDGWRRTIHKGGEATSVAEYSPEEMRAAKCNQPPDDWQLPEKNIGYLLVRCNGGLNQMRAAICDMVAVARLLNATMVIPELDKTSFWADQSDFDDVFDTQHFIASLSEEVRVLKGIPAQHQHRLESVYTMDPISWSNVNYYSTIVYPLLKRYKVLRLNHTDSRVANNVPDVSVELQKLRCRVNYHALQFTKPIRDLGNTIIRRLLDKGPFIALHLRYEMDMLSFTGCTYGCTKREEQKLTKLRMRTERWKEKVIDGAARRMEGLCPMTPEEIALMLRAMGYNKTMQIYIASGRIYGGKRRMARLLKLFPNAVRKEMLAMPEELEMFKNHSSQMAALDYMVSVASHVFVSTFHGNMASLVEGHRRYLGHRKTIAPDRKRLVGLFEAYEKGEVTWSQLSQKVQEAHANRLGAPANRLVIPGHPKEEDNFWSNPFECMCQEDYKAVVEKPALRILNEPKYLEEERLQRGLGDGSSSSSRSSVSSGSSAVVGAPSLLAATAAVVLPQPRVVVEEEEEEKAERLWDDHSSSSNNNNNSGGGGGKDADESDKEELVLLHDGDGGVGEGGGEGDGISERATDASSEWEAGTAQARRMSRDAESSALATPRM